MKRWLLTAIKTIQNRKQIKCGSLETLISARFVKAENLDSLDESGWDYGNTTDGIMGHEAINTP